MSENQDPDRDHGDDELTDLDAFLNEFGQSGGDGADPELQPEEFDSVVSEPAGEAVPELGAEDIVESAADGAPHELDLDMGGGSDAVTADAIDEFVSDLNGGHGTGTGFSATQHHTPDLFASDDMAAQDTSDDYPATDEALIADEEETEVGKRLDVSTIGVALLSLIIAAVVGWFAVSLHSQVAELRADVGRLRQPPPVVAAPNPELEARLTRINQRLDTLAATVTASVGHTGGQEQAMSAVSNRLDDLDKSVASLRAQLIELQRRPIGKAAAAGATRHPVQARQQTKAERPAQKSTVAASGAWVVNVVSLTDGKAAQRELTRLRHEGIEHTEVQKVTMNGRLWYRVRVTGFSSREEAQVYSDMIKNKLKATPWVAHR